jgi:hypothetical protein
VVKSAESNFNGGGCDAGMGCSVMGGGGNDDDEIFPCAANPMDASFCCCLFALFEHLSNLYAFDIDTKDVTI